jgi:hypothetical protein
MISIGVISVGLFFEEVRAELEAIRKVRNFRKSVGLSEPDLIEAVN